MACRGGLPWEIRPKGFDQSGRVFPICSSTLHSGSDGLVDLGWKERGPPTWSTMDGYEPSHGERTEIKPSTRLDRKDGITQPTKVETCMDERRHQRTMEHVPETHRSMARTRRNPSWTKRNHTSRHQSSTRTSSTDHQVDVRTKSSPIRGKRSMPKSKSNPPTPQRWQWSVCGDCSFP